MLCFYGVDIIQSIDRRVDYSGSCATALIYTAAMIERLTFSASKLLYKSYIWWITILRFNLVEIIICHKNHVIFKNKVSAIIESQAFTKTISKFVDSYKNLL